MGKKAKAAHTPKQPPGARWVPLAVVVIPRRPGMTLVEIEVDPEPALAAGRRLRCMRRSLATNEQEPAPPSFLEANRIICVVSPESGRRVWIYRPRQPWRWGWGAPRSDYAYFISDTDFAKLLPAPKSDKPYGHGTKVERCKELLRMVYRGAVPTDVKYKDFVNLDLVKFTCKEKGWPLPDRSAFSRAMGRRK